MLWVDMFNEYETTDDDPWLKVAEFVDTQIRARAAGGAVLTIEKVNAMEVSVVVRTSDGAVMGCASQDVLMFNLMEGVREDRDCPMVGSLHDLKEATLALLAELAARRCRAEACTECSNDAVWN